jgi:hypothetical protein
MPALLDGSELLAATRLHYLRTVPTACLRETGICGRFSVVQRPPHA